MPNERPAGIQSQPGGLEPRLIDAMMRPEFYPDHPARIEAKQTHMSYVFLAGEYVYKIKKSDPLTSASAACGETKPPAWRVRRRSVEFPRL